MAQLDHVLTVDEAGERLRVKRRTVYRLIATGALRSVHVGVDPSRGLRVREDDIAAFIEARTSDAPTPDPEILSAGN